MKRTFCGFYSLNDEQIIEEIWNSDETLFIFDTNCLLNLYRCEDNTRDDILSVMGKISDRIWLPFFVCLEYQKNRRDVIADSIDNLTSISDSLNDAVSSVVNSLSKGKVKKHLYNALSDGVHSLQNEIKPFIEKFIIEHIEPRVNGKREINKRDIIRERIDILFDNKCGSPPSKDWINEVNKNGISRYNNSIPPGFKDSKKEGRKNYLDLEFEEKYGDLYIWTEILNKGKDDKIKNVIFVCDDNKDDWWYKKNGIIHGPLESLQTEIFISSNVNNFKLLNQATFLQDAQKYLPNISIDSNSLKEVQEIYDSRRDSTVKGDIYNFTHNNKEMSESYYSTTKNEIYKFDSEQELVKVDYFIDIYNEVKINISALKELEEKIISFNENGDDLFSLSGGKLRGVIKQLTFISFQLSEHLKYPSNVFNEHFFINPYLIQMTIKTLDEAKELISYFEFCFGKQ